MIMLIQISNSNQQMTVVTATTKSTRCKVFQWINTSKYSEIREFWFEIDMNNVIDEISANLISLMIIFEILTCDNW